MTGTGQPDLSNRHPERKAPCLVHEGHGITERGAILTALSPSGLAPATGTATSGSILTWMTWYQGLEPVLILAFCQISHPSLSATFRGAAEVTARIRRALERGPRRLGDHFSAADPLIWDLGRALPGCPGPDQDPGRRSDPKGGMAPDFSKEDRELRAAAPAG